MSIPNRLVRLAALLAIASWALAAAAQEAGPAAVVPAEPPPPEFIPIGSVTTRANTLEERLKGIEADLAEAAVETRAEADLAEVAEAIDGEREGLDAALERSTLTSELASFAARWDGFDESLVGIEQALAKRVRQLGEQLEELQEIAELWKRTAAAARKDAAPQAVRTRIEDVRKRLRPAVAAITRQRNAALELQSRAAELLESIRPVQERIGEASGALAAGLLTRQEEPLWRSRPALDQVATDFRLAAEGIASLFRDLRDDARRSPGALLGQILLILGMAWIFRRTRAHVDARHAASGVDPGGALRHPVSAAILAGSFLTPLINPESGRGLLLLGTIVALPFWYRVLSGMLPATLHGTLRGAALLTLVEAFRLGVVATDFGGRSILLAELIAGVAGVWWLRRPVRLALIPARLRNSGWMRLLDGWLRFVLVLFSIGVVCAIAGYTSSAARLCMLAISSSYYGAGIVALVRVLELVSEHILSASFFDGIYMIRDRRVSVVSGLSKVLRAGGFGVWVHMGLTRAQLWEPLSGAAGSALARPIGFGTAHFTLGGILAFFLTVWLSWLVARFVSSALNDEIFPRFQMPQGVPFAMSRFAHYGVLVMGFIIAMGTLGFSLDRVTLLLSALGVGIGFGLQTVVNNFVSGLILLFERPVRVGDRVQIVDLLGEVTHIGIRASRIRTVDGSEMIVPNGDLVASHVINWTLSDDKRRVIIPVGVAYGTDPEKVLEILKQVARENPDVLEDPAPEPLFTTFGDSSLDFELRAWTESVRGWYAVRSDLAVAINRALADAGIHIPFPQRDLHLRNLDEVRDTLGRR